MDRDDRAAIPRLEEVCLPYCQLYKGPGGITFSTNL